MPIRHAEAEWTGDLREGKGTMKLGSGAYEGAYSFGSRFEENPGSNPEELIGASYAGCYSMALSGALGRAGFTPTRIHTTAQVHIERQEGGFSITRLDLTTEAVVPGIDAAVFQETAQATKTTCPVSRALNIPDVRLEAKLVG